MQLKFEKVFTVFTLIQVRSFTYNLMTFTCQMLSSCNINVALSLSFNFFLRERTEQSYQIKKKKNRIGKGYIIATRGCLPSFFPSICPSHFANNLFLTNTLNEFFQDVSIKLHAKRDNGPLPKSRVPIYTPLFTNRQPVNHKNHNTVP